MCAGIQVTHGVCFHGLALNCNMDLSWFEHIVPCGVEGKAVTSLTEICRREVATNHVQPVILQQLADTIGFKLRQ